MGYEKLNQSFRFHWLIARQLALKYSGIDMSSEFVINSRLYLWNNPKEVSNCIISNKYGEMQF